MNDEAITIHVPAGRDIDLYVHQALAKQQKIAVIWSVEDVLGVRPHLDEPGHCAVLDLGKLTAGDIAFGSNSWRADTYESALRHAIGRRT